MAKQSCGQPEAVANVDSSVASGDLRMTQGEGLPGGIRFSPWSPESPRETFETCSGLRMTTHGALFDPLVVLLKGHGPILFLGTVL
ncbi:hypothetical protein ACFLXE_06085 [Chloroflexota bacterium]